MIWKIFFTNLSRDRCQMNATDTIRWSQNKFCILVVWILFYSIHNLKILFTNVTKIFERWCAGMILTSVNLSRPILESITMAVYFRYPVLRTLSSVTSVVATDNKESTSTSRLFWDQNWIKSHRIWNRIKNSIFNPVPISTSQFNFWLVVKWDILKFRLIVSLSPIGLFCCDIKTQE